jgi:predicted Rossmann fold nucleotide-binding protein DprA/Smf involved in DNA uptake
VSREADAKALLLLCATLPRGRGDDLAPLSTAEWQQTGTRLRRAGLECPGALLGTVPEFWATTGLETAEVDRLRRLLDRGPTLEAELERLDGLGIRVITRADERYPERLRERLRGLAPPVLYGGGEWQLLDQAGLAIVGSRGVDEAGAAFTRGVACRCARDGLAVVTGGAKGVDRIAMHSALEAGGTVVGVMAGDLERTLWATETRRWLETGRLLLLSPYHPRTGFTVANAMARNKLIYALAEYGLVVSSAHGQGGTWAGAREVRLHGWVPLFVRDEPSSPDGNRELLRPAALSFPPLAAIGDEPLHAWLARHAGSGQPSSASPSEAADLLPVVWPHLAHFLRIPRLPDEVAAAFHLLPGQAQEWLHRAEAQGQVRVEGGPDPRYCLSSQAQED